MRATARNRSRTKTATRVAQAIVREIHRRGLETGDMLISEQKMVERYGVARGSLREALRFLELQGVLRMKPGPGGGPMIDTPNGQHLASTLALLLQFVGAPFRAIIETRWVVEPGIAGLAAVRASAENLGAMSACLDSMRDNIDDGPLFQRENRRFHDLVAFASGNAVFAFLLPALHSISEGSGIEYSDSERRRTIKETRQIFGAIEKRDAASASRSMGSFFEASLAHLDRTYPEIMSRPLTWADMAL